MFERILKNFGYLKKESLSNEGFVSKNVLRRYRDILYSKGFNAAKVDNLTNDWLTTSNSIDTDIQTGVSTMRSRAKSFFQNNDYVQSYKYLSRGNLIGPNGIILQNRATLKDGSPDIEANQLIESKWKEWSKKQYCTMNGMSLFRVKLLYSDYMIHTGEFILRKIRPLKRQTNKFGFSLELIEPNDLDTGLVKDLGDGRVIIMGIEYNKWRKPIAYYIKERSPKTDTLYTYYQDRKTIRVPADDIIHTYDPEFIKQSRGYPEIASGMLRLNGVEGWEEASIYNARYAANNFGVIERNNPEGTSNISDSDDDDGTSIIESEIGDMRVLPPGYTMHYVDPKFPTDQHKEFLKTQLRAIAAGMGVDYNSLANDLESANYSSLKAGRLSSQATWMIRHRIFIEDVLEDIFAEWLKMGLLNGAIPLPISRFNALNQPIFKGRTWKQLEPLKEAQANKLMHDELWKSSTDIISEMGGDINDVYATLGKEQDLRNTHKLKSKKSDPADDDEDINQKLFQVM